VDQARSWNRQVMVDLIAAGDVGERAGQVDAMGVDYVCVHTAFDVQARGRDPLEELHQVQPALQQAAAAVAGGVKPETMARIAPYGPQIVIVGGFITGHAQPRQAALEIRRLFVQEDYGEPAEAL
jgi:3-hexulose-6-phosphate synthase